MLDEYQLKYEKWLRQYPGAERECPDFSTWMMRYYPLPPPTDKEIEWPYSESMKSMVKRAKQFKLILSAQRLTLRMYANTYKDSRSTHKEIKLRNKALMLEKLSEFKRKIRLLRQLNKERENGKHRL